MAHSLTGSTTPRRDWRESDRVVRILPALLLVCLLPSPASAAVDYLREIKPILARDCVKCHGATQQKGGLQLDTAAAALRGGKHGPLWQPKDPENSLLIQVIEGRHSEVSKMPYKRLPLDTAVVALMRQWIAAGAPTPAREEPSSDQHWAFQKPRRQSVPPLAPHPVDAFIRDRLAREGLSPAPQAPRETLLRRVCLDLTGLPPTLEEQKAFLEDQAPGAFERLVDRLLASPHYGERWGRWWLDGARYADSNGYSIDLPRSIWPFRDWVVRAFNTDMPFDRFTLLQIAGDLLKPQELPKGVDATEALIATGFHRNTQINHEGGVDAEQFRIESVIDRVNTTATVWLGISFGCAQCHDHKFDPFTQKDYYRFMAFFNSCENDGHATAGNEALNWVELATPEQLTERDRIRQEHSRLDKALEEWAVTTLVPQQESWEKALKPEAKSKLSKPLQEALATPAESRTAESSNRVWAAFRNQNAEYERRRKEMQAQRPALPKFTTSLVMKELKEPRETHVFIKGDFTRLGERVEPGTPEALPSLPVDGKPDRLHLARWLTARDNPLVARVIVNRVWLQLFGRGLVDTENDFGSQGAAPTHPELLDWLARDWMQGGWSFKRLHRLLVTSATYQQSAKTRPDLNERDAGNRLLGRQSRLRLDAELVRDSLLVASGLLDPRVGGPPVFPPQPTGLGAFTQSDRPWVVSQGRDRYRRALYTHLQRSTLHPALTVFDAPDAFQTCTRRLRSNTPLQALTLLNDTAFMEFAEALGKRLTEDPRLSDTQRIDLGFQRCLGRAPSAIERERLLAFLKSERESAPTLGEAVWQRVGRVLLNLDETITRE